MLFDTGPKMTGIIGLGSNGKSYWGTRHCYGLFTKGTPVYADTPLVDLRTKNIVTPAGWRAWVPVDVRTFGRSWASGYVCCWPEVQLLRFCAVFLDEVANWARADEYRNLDKVEKGSGLDVRRWLVQERKNHLHIIWTHRAENLHQDLRNYTSELVMVRSFGPTIRVTLADGQSKKDAVTLPIHWRDSSVYDLYDNKYIVGNGLTGEGYSRPDEPVEPAGWYDCKLPTIGERWIPCRKPLREDQFTCLVQNWGHAAVGIYREDAEVLSTGSVRGSRPGVCLGLKSRYVKGVPLPPGLLHGSRDQAQQDYQNRLRDWLDRRDYVIMPIPESERAHTLPIVSLS